MGKRKKDFVLRISADLAEDLIPMLESQAKMSMQASSQMVDAKLQKKELENGRKMIVLACKLKKKLTAWHKANKL
jgi:hypothetical protein